MDEKEKDGGRQLVATSAYDRIADVSAFVANFGKEIADSKMFGCANLAQGRVLAMACVSERCNPVELTRRYHIIGGNLSMRADAMLAEFRHRGGDHVLIERTSERAEIELRVGKGRGARAERFAFSWKEAKIESYCYCTDKHGKPTTEFKNNWQTPRRRMQMLWARLISDSVRTMMPEVCAGQYTPEEISGDTLPELQDGDIVDAVGDVVVEEAAVTPAEPKMVPPPFDVAPDPAADEPGQVTRAQLLEMRDLKAKLGINQDTWDKVLGKFGVPSARALQPDDAARVLDWLRRRVQKDAEKSEMDKWAENAGRKEAAGN